jgi:hypothetical protein
MTDCYLTYGLTSICGNKMSALALLITQKTNSEDFTRIARAEATKPKLNARTLDYQFKRSDT